LIVTVLTGFLPVLGLAEGWQDIGYGLVILATVAVMTARTPGRG
jgi:ribose/xylose/arabinose/galactoside ABC-type transport system permease subunit